MGRMITVCGNDTVFVPPGDDAEQARYYAKKSEKWAVGEVDGTPVSSSDPTYHNNSKYYAEQAEDCAEQSCNCAEDAAEYAQQAKQFVGAPRVASTIAGMTDHDLIYVYTGSETGYTSGHWYYWNGSAWTDGGVYNSTAVSTDKTLTVENVPADAKAAGDQITDLKSALINYNARDIMVGQTLHNNKISSGISWTWDSYNKSVHVVGTATEYAKLGLFTSQPATFPDGIIAGGNYILWLYSTHGGGLGLFISTYDENDSLIETKYYSTSDGLKKLDITIPSSAHGIRIGFYVSANETVDDYISFAILNTETNEELFNDIEELDAKITSTAVKYVGDIYYEIVEQTRLFNISKEGLAGDVIYFRLLDWTGDSYDRISVYTSKNGVRDELARIEPDSTYKWVVVNARDDFDTIALGVHTPEAPSSPQTFKFMLCLKSEWNTISMLERSWAEGKYLSILGASTSTFEGYIPEGYAKYYPYTGSAYDGSGFDCVTKVHDTYWMKVCDALGMNLLVNNSSSGSFLTTGHGSDSMAGCGDRCISLHTEEHDPDVIIIQMGMNDFNYETDLGTYDGTSVDFPTDTSKFREAYSIMLNKILTRYPRAIVICGTIPNHEDNFSQTTFPERNDDGVLLKSFNEAIKDIADLFGVKVVDWYASGISYQNLNIYTQDWNPSSRYGMHANRWGHSLMANAVIELIDSSSHIRFNNRWVIHS